MSCKHDPDCRDPFCCEDELAEPCGKCGHRLGMHRDHDCQYGRCPCKGFVSRGTEPCPCCACNPSGTTAHYASLAEEVHAHARWEVFGCPNSPPIPLPFSGECHYGEEGVKALDVRWFPKTLFARGHAWSLTEDGHEWRKSHTARTWAWYRVIT